MSTTKFPDGYVFDSRFQFLIGHRYNFKHILKTIVFVQIIVNRGNGEESQQTSKKQTNRVRVMLEGP